MRSFLPASRFLFPAFFIIFSLALLDPASGQDYIDDPNRDNTPQWFIDSLQSKGGGQKVGQIITVDGYDNFYIAVDFAEGHISVNPNEPDQFFTAFNIDNGWGTLDGGLDWYGANISWGASPNGDPVTAYDSLGNLYYETMYGSIVGCKVARSSDNGQSWTPGVTSISGFDKNWIAADQTAGPYSNYVYTTMTGGNGGNFARSTDFGENWATTFSPSTQSLPGMMVCVGPAGDVQGGSVYVVTNGGNTFSSTYTFYHSVDGGATFQFKSSQNFAGYVGVNSNGRHSVENMRTRPYPFIAADNSYGPYRGRLYIIYASNQPAGNGNKPDIWCRYSDNNGSTWSTPTIVNDDPNTTENHQFAPAPWCDKNTGRLYVQWMDTRDCPTSDSALIYGTYSDTGGEDFMPNVAISNEKMKINCNTCGGGGSPRYQGDYNGIVSNDRVSMSTWSDFRYGTYASFTGYFPDFALVMSPMELELSGVDTVWATVPDVKLYDDTVYFSAIAEDPGSGSFTISFPADTMLTEYPDSLPIVIEVEDVALGDYTMTVKARGPNGTPVHIRDVTLMVTELLPPVTDFEASETEICAGGSVDFFDLSINFPDQWFWTFTGGEPSLSEEQNPEGITYNTPGSYDVKLIAANNAGFNELVKASYITINVAPEAPSGENVYVCGEEPVPPLEAMGEDIRWYSDPELTDLLFAGSSFETGQTEPGMYTYYVTQTVNGCEGPAAEIMLSIGEIPDVALEPFDGICGNGTPIELSGGSPAEGSYFGTGVANGMFDPMMAAPGAVTIGYEYTNESQCSDTAYQDILVYAFPEVDLGPDTALCPDQEYVLDATDPVASSYLWAPGNEDSPTITVQSNDIGVGNDQEYSVVVTSAEGCEDVASVMISVKDCAAVPGIPGLNEVTLYPNPNDGLFSLEIKTTKKLDVAIYVYGADGEQVIDSRALNVNGNHNETINLPDLQAGIYYILIENEEGKVSKKFVVR